MSHEYESDSDSAPEEESVSLAAQRSRQKEIQAKNLLKQQQAEERAKRRQRNELYSQQRKQKEESQIDLLPEDILEQADKDMNDGTEEQELAAALQAETARRRAASQRPKKTVFDKGPVKVKVLQKKKKSLAPAKDTALSKRDRMLSRRSIERR